LKARNAAGEIILIEVQYQRQFDYLQHVGRMPAGRSAAMPAPK